MLKRDFWLDKIHQLWEKRSIIWLSGVRRVGKTTLCKMLNNINYFNCDLPSVMARLSDPEFFLNNLDTDKAVIFDEIHKLPDPSRLLKIAADEFPSLKIIATGSSTLEATKKFSDSLSGRKSTLYLSPFLWSEIVDNEYNITVEKRLLHGGLPQALLEKEKENNFFSEWIDSFFARDIQDLFEIRNKNGFITLLKVLLSYSGGISDVNELSKQSGLTRPTTMSYLQALSISHAITIVSPFFGGGTREIVKRPKIFGFDTGFVTYARGWDNLRQDDLGNLWEHLVLDELRAMIDFDKIHYWRDKSGREIDFIVQTGRDNVDIVECKINPEKLNISAIKEFRRLYPKGNNFCLSPYITTSYERKIQNLEICFSFKYV